jgi:hypothetical protein
MRRHERRSTPTVRARSATLCDNMRVIALRSAVLIAVVGAALAAAGPSVTIEKPKPRTVAGGGCRLLSDGTFSGTWGPAALPTLAFTIGPGATMADQLHANKAKYSGPAKYPNEIIAVYLGKTALEDSYMGLGTIVIAADGHSGTFALNDGKASGRFDCGAVPSR